MGAASTLSSTIVYHVEPYCKGQHTNLAGQHQKDSVQAESVSPVDSSVDINGFMGPLQIIICL